VTASDAEQSYGWDPVIAGGHAWFLDNGANDFSQSFRGGGRASGPIHLVRVSLDDARDWELFTPFGRRTAPSRIRRRSSRRAASPSRTTAATQGSPRSLRRSRAVHALWEHGFGAGNHFLLWPDTGEIAVNDFQEDVGEHAVVLDLETGVEKGRAAIPSPMQSVVFQAPASGATSTRVRSRRSPAWPSQESDDGRRRTMAVLRGGDLLLLREAAPGATLQAGALRRDPADAPGVPRGIRPRTGLNQIPVVVTPEDETLQDSSVILDEIERRFPEPPLYPATPRQKISAICSSSTTTSS
jgi:hypothetical protein